MMVKFSGGLVRTHSNDDKKPQIKIMLKNVLPMLIFDLIVTCVIGVVYSKFRIKVSECNTILYVSGLAYFYYGVFFVARNIATILACSFINDANLIQFFIRTGFTFFDLYGITSLLSIAGATLFHQNGIKELECLRTDEVQKWWLAVCVLSGIYLGYLLLIIIVLLVFLDLVVQFRLRLNTLGREHTWLWLDAHYSKIPFAKEFFHKIR